MGCAGAVVGAGRLSALVLCLAICVSIRGIHFVSGGDLFLMLAKSSGAFVMIVWIFIIVAHFAMRRQTKHEQRDPTASARSKSSTNRRMLAPPDD